MSSLKDTTTVTDPTTNIFDDAISALSTILFGIPLHIGLFKGPTQHVPFDTAVKTSNDVGAQMMKIYDAFTESQQHDMYLTARRFYETDVLARFTGWWNGSIDADYATWSSKGWLSSEREMTYHYLCQPVFYFMFYEDATRASEMFQDRYTDRVNAKVLKPLGKYMTSLADPGTPPTIGDNPETSTASFFPGTDMVKYAFLAVVAFIIYKVVSK